MAIANDVNLKTVTFILAGGRGERLAPLTRWKSKPAVPFGDGHIIDFTLANCLRANLPHPLVLTQYQPLHLTEHVGRWWLRQELSAEFPEAAPVCVPPPKQAYSGSATALFENFDKHTSASGRESAVDRVPFRKPRERGLPLLERCWNAGFIL